MADDKNIQSGLSIAGVNLYGVPDEKMQSLLDAQEAGLQALEQRYANPNWFNVAAGFFKPQLGGFAASLGSASQAMGENLEKQRESQIPIAKMRSDIALTQMAMGQKKQATDLVTKHEGAGAPLHELPDLVARLTQLGSPLAAGPKARLDEARKSQDTMVQRAQLIRGSNEQELAKISSDLANKVITIEEAGRRRAALPPVPDVPDLFAPPPKPSDKDAGTAPPIGGTPPPAGTTPPPTSPLTPIPPGSSTPPTVVNTPVKIAINPVVSLNDEKGDTAAKITARAQQAADYAKQGSETYSYLRSVAGPEMYNSYVTPIKNALGLLGYGEKDPVKKAALEDKARQVMNVLSGDIFNAILKSVNTGVTGKVGDIYAQISLPIEDFVRAKFPPRLQDYAKDLAQNLAQASIARQKLGGVSPNAARNAELHLYGEASPSISGATPLSAVKNLAHLHTSFDQLRDMHNFIDQVDTGQHPEYEVAQGNDITRIFDITRSKGYKKIADDYAKTHQAIEKATGERK